MYARIRSPRVWKKNEDLNLQKLAVGLCRRLGAGPPFWALEELRHSETGRWLFTEEHIVRDTV